MVDLVDEDLRVGRGDSWTCGSHNRDGRPSPLRLHLSLPLLKWTLLSLVLLFFSTSNMEFAISQLCLRAFSLLNILRGRDWL